MPSHRTTALVATFSSAIVFLTIQFVVAPRLPITSVEVPPLTGLSPEQARGLLDPLGLLLVLDSEQADERVPPGTLSQQRPLGGSRLRRGDEVHAFIARRPEPSRVPRLAGLTVETAREALGRARLHLGTVTPVPSDHVTAGVVLASIPEPGEALTPDSLVELTVSSGPSQKPVPPLVGKRLSQARQILEQAGFVLGTTRYGSHDDYDSGVVIGQVPKANEPAAPGRKIDLTIND
jgi:beta-lactam-binding protein with PASTA domain